MVSKLRCRELRDRPSALASVGPEVPLAAPPAPPSPLEVPLETKEQRSERVEEWVAAATAAAAPPGAADARPDWESVAKNALDRIEKIRKRVEEYERNAAHIKAAAPAAPAEAADDGPDWESVWRRVLNRPTSLPLKTDVFVPPPDQPPTPTTPSTRDVGVQHLPGEDVCGPWVDMEEGRLHSQRRRRRRRPAQPKEACCLCECVTGILGFLLFLVFCVIYATNGGGVTRADPIDYIMNVTNASVSM